ncbi:MAG: diguanylate cyclase domain-containing protein [Burkholderiales bacterium]
MSMTPNPSAAGPAAATPARADAAEAAILADLVDQLYVLSRPTYWGTPLNAGIISFVLWEVAVGRDLLIWLVLVVSATLGRYLLYRRYRARRPPPAEAEYWRDRFVLGTGVMGCLWGLLGSWLFPADDVLRQFLVVFLVGGMVASALGVLTPVRRAFLAFAIPALTPMIVAVFWQQTQLHLVMGLMMCVYAAVMMGTFPVVHNNYVGAQRMRHENSGLVARLSALQERTESVNRELSARVTEQARTQAALEASTARLEALIDASPIAIVVMDRNRLTQRWNRAAERLFGWAESEVLGKTVPSVPPELQAESVRFGRQLLDGERLENVEVSRRHKDGTALTVSMSGAPVHDAGGTVVAMMLMMSDVTERQRAARREQLEFAVTRVLAEAQTAAEAIQGVLAAIGALGGWAYGGHWQLDPANGQVCCDQVWHSGEPRAAAFAEQLRGRRSNPQQPSGGMVCKVFITRTPQWIEDIADTDALRRRDLAMAAGLRTAWAFPVLVGSESFGSIEFYGTERVPRDGALLEYARTLGSQIGQYLARKEAEAHLQFYADHDALTGLPNRAMFSRRLAQALAQATRHGRGTAVLFIDLDGFKAVNDTLGHDAGDSVLKAVSARLRDCLREGDTLGRQGGDEFVVLIEDVATREGIADVADKILETVARPVEVSGASYRLTASIGISVSPEHGEEAPALIQHADMAMYRSKELGKNTFRFYDTPAG